MYKARAQRRRHLPFLPFRSRSLAPSLRSRIIRRSAEYTCSTLWRVLADVSMYGHCHSAALAFASSTLTLRNGVKSALLPTKMNGI